MATFPTEEQLGPTAAATPEQKPEKKPKPAPHKPRVAPAKDKAGKKASAAKKAPNTPKAGRAHQAVRGEEKPAAREGSKTVKVLDLLRRPEGANLKQIMKATGWQPHTVRGFIRGTLGKKMGLSVTSMKGGDGERIYSLPK
jgi:hypothetical protein